MRKVNLDNGLEAWGFSSAQYIKNAVTNVEQKLNKDGEKLPKKAPTLFAYDYRPELDLSPELPTDKASYYQSLIGILRWIEELGRIDICCEVSMMATCVALPRYGHLNTLYRIFGYLKNHHNAEMVFDPSQPVINESDFPDNDWSTSEFG